VDASRDPDRTRTLPPGPGSGQAADPGHLVPALVLLHSPGLADLPRWMPLGSEPLVLGRGIRFAGGALVEDPAMSRRHLEVRLAADGRTPMVRDLGSKNGTLRRDGPLASIWTPLEIGEVLRTGDTFWQVVLRMSPAPPQELLPGWVGDGEASRRVRGALSRLARQTATVLIQGETGTGKEVAARALWRLGGDRRPFVAFNSASVPPTLIDSVLFGHVQGAFTGAHRAQPGLFQAADGGVLFLDEIGELPPESQARLLRVLEEGAVLPLGAIRAVPVRVRVIAATARDVPREVREGRFRQDLYARLARLVLTLPPLRDRLEDLPALFRHFAAGRSPAPDLLWAMFRHPWPMNVREVQGLVETLRVEQPGDGPLVWSSSVADRFVAALRSIPAASGLGHSQMVDSASSRTGSDESRPRGRPPVAGPPGPGALADALRRHRGNVSRVAAEMGLDRAWCYRLLRRHGLDPEEFR